MSADASSVMCADTTSCAGGTATSSVTLRGDGLGGAAASARGAGAATGGCEDDVATTCDHAAAAADDDEDDDVGAPWPTAGSSAITSSTGTPMLLLLALGERGDMSGALTRIVRDACRGTAGGGSS